jgi:hypothetical protein
LIRDVWFTGGDEDDGFGYDYGNGKWYSFRLERVLSGTIIRGTPNTPKHGWKTSLKQTVKAGKNDSRLKLHLPRDAISSRPSPASGKNSSPEWIRASPEGPLRQQAYPQLVRG